MKDKEKIFKLLRESVETPQESFAVEEMISKIEGTLPPIETVTETKKTFNGINFYRDGRGNYLCSITLHRFVWQYVNGEIPEGYEIHHQDSNHDNNDISNLELLPREEHIAIPKELKKDKKPVMKNLLVSTAEKSIRHFTLEVINFALQNVVTRRLVKFMMKFAFALNVARSFQLIVMDIRNFVAMNVRFNTPSRTAEPK